MMVETHPNPESAWSDGPQSLTFDGFKKMMDGLKPYLQLWQANRAVAVAS